MRRFEHLNRILTISNLDPQTELDRAEAHLKTIPDEGEVAMIYREYCENLREILKGQQ